MECLRKLGRPATRNVLMPLQTRLTEADRTYLEAELPRFVQFQRTGEVLAHAGRLYQEQDVDGLAKLLKHVATPLPGADLLPLTRIADVTMESIRWKWKYHLAAGMLHLIAGDPGEGKSAVALDLA